MKFLVTGGLGFIGSNFIKKIINYFPECSVLNIDAGLYGSNEKNLDEIKNNENYEFIKGNITDFELMEKTIAKSDIVINFAAESFVDRSIANAKPFLDSNVMGVYNILEILKEKKKKLIQVSTDEVFGSLQTNSADELFRFNPSSPYASSKACAELLINSYNITYDLDCKITRCTNNYGSHQFPEKLIPKTILLAQKNKKIPIYGSGKNIRDWIFVDDHCNAIVKVIENGEKGQNYNISADNEIDNITIVKKILELMNKSEDLIEFVEDRPGHDFRYSMNSTKIRTELGWKELVNFDEALEKTVNWYVHNENWWANLSQTVQNKEPWK
jgi:dTDP-glucose 4,6-dehydratase